MSCLRKYSLTVMVHYARRWVLRRSCGRVAYGVNEENFRVSEGKYEVIYLTGPPASGKSTLVAVLEERVQPLKAFVYSKVLADYLSQKSVNRYSQDNLREMSARVITPDDIEIVDTQLLDFVADNINKSHIVIDSHAVTKEKYGFRVMTHFHSTS